MIIWIASYPKSGNTWVRLFLKSYYKNLNKDFISHTFPKIQDLLDLSIDYRNFIEIVKNWETIQDKLNLDKKLKFLKTHNALCTINGSKFTSKKNTIGAIYLVRDPRDVLVSYSAHLGQTYNQVLKGMIDPNNGELADYKNEEWRRSIMGKWSDHYNSWKSYNYGNILTIKYEDLSKNPFKEFSKIINYLNKVDNIEVNRNLILKSIDETSFEKLKKEEEIFGFEEATNHTKFFRKGKVGDWKNNVDKSLIYQIEKIFNKEMKELGYLT